MSKQTFAERIEAHILRVQAHSRGGGIEISLDFVGKKYSGYKMTAYQNYLGGGMLGRICNSCNMKDWEDDKKLDGIAENLRKYFHSLTNPEGTFEAVSYEQNQNMPVSGY